ncbi:hypothetical protein QTL95_18510 [Rhizobium sp. S152]|uniref:hypothetical protein n=1 Tax=Rhizobium sp. S152 TaxID=3055038 RepID=UPI0025AA1292|nr:hypothetical protein [Rhizobium sp. S152]MDM9627888.1 hypothetical protein [Rhizobium sp. S152]
MRRRNWIGCGKRAFQRFIEFALSGRFALSRLLIAHRLNGRRVGLAGHRVDSCCGIEIVPGRKSSDEAGRTEDFHRWMEGARFVRWLTIDCLRPLAVYLGRMLKTENQQPRRRDSTSAVERRERLEATTQVAMATINGEAEARRAKTERLRLAREAAVSQKRPDSATAAKDKAE